MNENIYLAEKIKVGFNLRADTYTGALGFVIPWDKQKKCWRQENSWKNWREKYISEDELNAKILEYNLKNSNHLKKEDYYIKKWFGSSDEKLIVKELENIALGGFVLNKKAGGYSSGWNHRQAVCRVYDPRGFEFEISVENLLYILEHTNSIVGKGLEGKFMYGWQGKNLVLLPENAPEFANMQEFTKLQESTVSLKTIKEGNICITKQNERLLYLGKYPVWDYRYGENNGRRTSHTRNFYTKKQFVFFNYKTEAFEVKTTCTTISKLDGIDEEWLEKAELLNYDSHINLIDEAASVYTPVKFEELDPTEYYTESEIYIFENGLARGLGIYYYNIKEKKNQELFYKKLYLTNGKEHKTGPSYLGT